MDKAELLITLDRVLEETKTAVLATLDANGYPYVRWMTPRRMRGRDNALYCVAMRSSPKVEQLRQQVRSTWLVQTPTLSEVINITGVTTVVESATLVQEFLESAGRDVFMIWKNDPPPMVSTLVMLETIIEHATYMRLQTGATQTFSFV